jgi:hypothetical protein
MVKIGDLMIGNYILARDKVTDVCEVTGYDQEFNGWYEGISTDRDCPWHHYPDACFPIELTKEWLEKLGFEYYEPLDHWRIIHNECWYEVHGRDGFYWFTFSNLSKDEYNAMPDRKVQYVHQLQNLFYCLSGVKLKLINE